MTSLYMSTDVEHGNCEHRPNVETSLLSEVEQTTRCFTREQLLLDSMMVIVDDGCDDEEEFANDDELIAFLSSSRVGKESSSQQHPNQEPTVPASEKSLSDCGCVQHNTSSTVTPSASTPVHGTKSVYSTNTPALYSENNWYPNNTPGSPDGYLSMYGHNYYGHYYYPEAESFFPHPWGASLQKMKSEETTISCARTLEPSQSQPQETYPYYPTSEISGSEKRPSVVEFERWLDNMSKQLAELYKVEPTVLATNPGSAEHHLKKCKPCIFNQKASGCKEADNCSHCHLCDKDIFRFMKNTKVKIGKRIRRLADRGSPKSEISELLESTAAFGLN